MRLLAFSDVHGDLEACARLVEAAAEADLVIGAGDYARMHRDLEPTLAALEPIADKTILIPGNNETEAALRAHTSAQVLHCQEVRRRGLSVVGIGCAIPPLPPEVGGFDMTEEEADLALARFGSADILVTHSPPHGVADRLRGGRSVGSQSILAAVERIAPRLVLCGHVHDSWGERGRIGPSEVANLGPGPCWFDL